MSAVLQIGDTSLTGEELSSLLSKYQLVPQLAKEMLIAATIKDYEITKLEQQQAWQNFCRQQQINKDRDLNLWLQQHQLDREYLQDKINHELQLQKFKTDKWEHQLESYFCQRKSQIDRVVFSTIRVRDVHVAEEIYLRLVSEEATFVNLAPLYSEGIEAKTKGISGLIEFGKLDPIIANTLMTLQPHEILPPLQIGDWWLVLQLEAIVPAQLNEEMRHRLKEELFNRWIDEEVQKLLN
jgi:parvulin-like peptidyl-prolyl isomerase